MCTGRMAWWNEISNINYGLAANGIRVPFFSHSNTTGT
jgi:hypothetical protein